MRVFDGIHRRGLVDGLRRHRDKIHQSLNMSNKLVKASSGLQEKWPATMYLATRVTPMLWLHHDQEEYIFDRDVSQKMHMELQVGWRDLLIMKTAGVL